MNGEHAVLRSILADTFVAANMKRSARSYFKDPLDVAAKLLPKAMILGCVELSLIMTAAFGNEACTGLTELIVRTIVFVLLLAVGLYSMNWRDWTHEHWKHWTVNVVVVLTLLLGLQPKPFSCWLDNGDASDEAALRTLTILQACLVAIVLLAATIYETLLHSSKSRCLGVFLLSLLKFELCYAKR